MAESKVLLSITVVEEPGDDHIHVMIGLRDPHLQACPTCLAMYSLRISGALCDAVEQMKRDADKPAEAGSGEHSHLH